MLKSCSSDFNFFHLQLEGTFSFDTYVAPVSLDTIGGQSEGDHFTVTGWGTTSVSKIFNYIPVIFSISSISILYIFSPVDQLPTFCKRSLFHLSVKKVANVLMDQMTSPMV